MRKFWQKIKDEKISIIILEEIIDIKKRDDIEMKVSENEIFNGSFFCDLKGEFVALYSMKGKVLVTYY